MKITFFSIWVLLHEHSRITELQGKGEGIPLTPCCHFHLLRRHLVIRDWPGDCCRELTSAHSQQPDLNREPLVSGRKLLTTNLHTLDHGYMKYRSCTKWGKSDMQVGQIYLNQKEKKGHIKEAERCRGHM